MNWDWEKLQEKRQNQQNWQADNRGSRGQRPQDPQDPRDSRDPQDPKNSKNPQDPQNPRGQQDRRNQNNGGQQSPRPPRQGGQDPLQGLKNVKIPGGKWWLLAILSLWLLSGIYIVQPDEAGVVLRFGKYVRTTGAGPHYHLPYPVEQVYRPKVSQVRQAEVGYRSQTSGGSFLQGRVQDVDEEASMLTGDEKIVYVQFNIQYHLKPDGAVNYLFNVHEPDVVVRKAAEAAMREVIGKTPLESALTSGREQVQQEVTALLQEILNRYEVGVQVVAVQMQSVQPPPDVRDAYKDVASAREDKQRLINEAQAYERDLLPRAQGDAAAIVNQAEAYKQSRIRNALGQTQRFIAVLEEYRKAPELTRTRLLYETLEEIMSQPDLETIILPSGIGENVLPLLPLDSGTSSGASRVQPPASGQSQSGSGQFVPISALPFAHGAEVSA